MSPRGFACIGAVSAASATERVTPPSGGRQCDGGPRRGVRLRDLLRAAGEPVTDATPTRGAAARRYQRRVAALDELGYQIPERTGGEAEAGDSIEIVRRVRGSRGGEAGLVIRASARFVEAQRRAEAKEWSRLPAGRILLPP